MKTSNKEQQNNKRQSIYLNDLLLFEARKMWASSECGAPGDIEQACKETMEYIKKEAPHE